jgi:hypothetical protein
VRGDIVPYPFLTRQRWAKGIGDQRRQQALRQAHVQAPQSHTDHHRDEAAGEGQHQVGDDQEREARQQQPVAADAVRQRTGGPGRQ